MNNIPGLSLGLQRSLLRGGTASPDDGPRLPAHLAQSPLGAIAYAGAQQGYARAQQWWKTRRTWTVTISGDDELFYDAQMWLMDQGGEQTRRALTAKTYYAPNPHGPTKAELRFLADDDTPQDMEIGGHTVQVYVNEEGPSGSSQAMQQGMSLIKPPKLVFSAKSQAGRDAVLQLFRELREIRLKEKRTPGLMILDKWGDWRRRADLPPRPLESVVVKGTVIEDLHADLQDFVRREEDYVRRAIPYHRAYLLIGPPGTGKTSAVKAITNALNMDLWYAQLSGIDKDAKLADVFGEVRARGVLLLEDIDSLPAAIDRTDDDSEKKGEGDISTSGLLNALDGVATPHGLISIMTTNYPEHLDPALMRPGRIDRVFSFEYPDSETIHRHFEFFYGQPAEFRGEWPLGRSSAAVSEVFKRRMDDPEAAEADLLYPPNEDEERGWHDAGPAFSRSSRAQPIAPWDEDVLQSR